MIAITGANGLLGSFIVQRLLADKIPLMGIKRADSDLTLVKTIQAELTWQDADVLDPIGLTAAFRGVDTVIHAAGLVSFNTSRRDELFLVNTEGTRNVVNACIASGVKRLIYISSIAALGRQKGTSQLDEETKWEESSLNSHYAKSKYLAELEVFRGQEEGLEVSIVNPSVILAPADWEKSSAQLFKYIWKGQKFYTHGYMNVVDVRDVAESVVRLLSYPKSGERFIISGGKVEFIDLFRKIAQRFHKPAPTIRVSTALAGMAAWLEEKRAFLMGYEPLVTRQSVKMTRGDFTYSNQKSIQELGLRYQTLENTLDWCCSEFLERYTTNKD